MAEQMNMQAYYQQLLDEANARKKQEEEKEFFELFEEDLSLDNYSRWATDEEFCRDLTPIPIHSQEAIEKSGVSLYNRDGIAYADTSDSHTLIIGSSGSKKSRLVILPTILNLLKAGESMIVTDPKAELYERTSKKLKDARYKVYCINFRDESVMNSWNPFRVPREFYQAGKYDLAIGLLSDFASVTIPKTTSGADPFWDDMARAALMSLLLILFGMAENPEEINIRSLMYMRKTLLADGSKLKDVYKMMNPNSLVASYFASFANLPDKTYGSVITVMDTHLQKFLIRPSLTDMLCQNDVDFHKIGEEKTAIFLVMPDEKETYHSLIALFIQQCYEALIYNAQQYSTKSLPVRVNFLLDEFASLPQIKEFPSMIAAARSRNIRFDIVIQSEKQLTSKYGHHGETIKGNCNNWIYLYSREWDTLTSISRLCGELKSGNSLVTPSRLQRLDKNAGECLVIHGRDYPFLSHLDDISCYDDETFGDACHEEIGNRPIPVFDYFVSAGLHSAEWVRARLNQDRITAEEYDAYDRSRIEDSIRSLVKSSYPNNASLREFREKAQKEDLEKSLKQARTDWEKDHAEKINTGFSYGALPSEATALRQLFLQQEISADLSAAGEMPDHTCFSIGKAAVSKKGGVVYDDGFEHLCWGEAEDRYPLGLLPMLVQINHNNMVITAAPEKKDVLPQVATQIYTSLKNSGVKTPILLDGRKYDTSAIRYFRALKEQKKYPELCIWMAPLCGMLFDDKLPDLSSVPNGDKNLVTYPDLKRAEAEDRRDEEMKALADIPLPDPMREHLAMLGEELCKERGDKKNPDYTIVIYNLEQCKLSATAFILAVHLMGLPNAQVILLAKTESDWNSNVGIDLVEKQVEYQNKHDNSYFFTDIENAVFFFDEETNTVAAKQNALPSVVICLEES